MTRSEGSHLQLMSSGTRSSTQQQRSVVHPPTPQSPSNDSQGDSLNINVTSGCTINPPICSSTRTSNGHSFQSTIPLTQHPDIFHTDSGQSSTPTTNQSTSLTKYEKNHLSNPVTSTIGSSTLSPASLFSSLTGNDTVGGESSIPPTSPLALLPSYIRHLLIKGRVSSTPCYLSPFRCVLTRHPIHRDSTESHIGSLVSKIKEEGFDESLAIKAPLVAVRYCKPQAVPTRAAGTSRAVVYDSWSDNPLVYAISGAGRGEAIAQLVKSHPDRLNIKHQQRALAFYLLSAGENLTPWEIFLLSVSLNAADPNSRAPNYFERTDQIAFICLELSRRKQADATCRDIAVEICFNPLLSELRSHLKLSTSMIPVQIISENIQTTSPQLFQQLVRSRTIFSWLPPNTGVIVEQIPTGPLEILDVLLDMATCVNSERMKHMPQSVIQARERDTRKLGTRSNEVSIKAEGFLHAVAEDQLRHIFREIVPLETASSFDVLVIRDLVSVVFGAIQECSRQFRQSVASKKTSSPPSPTTDRPIKGPHIDSEPSSNHQGVQDSGGLLNDTVSLASSASGAATGPISGAYWIERIVYEATPGGLLAGLWNFPAAALVVLFYLYFVNQIQTFNKEHVQEKLLKVGTTLYRCIAELALTLRASKITLMTTSISMQLRVLEGASLLFRLALFGYVEIECFPIYPYVIPINSLNVNLLPEERQYEIKRIITSRLSPTPDYRHLSPAPSLSITQQRPLSTTTLLPTTNNNKRNVWYEARRLEVAATANRLRQEVELLMAGGTTTHQQNERIRVRRSNGKRSSSSIIDSNKRSGINTNGLDIIEVEIIDPSVLPMAQSAKLEFQSLVQGVITMLIDRHRCFDQQNGLLSNQTVLHPTQFLSVPANMVVLAAIKVALTFISPHFDRLAPHLVHWISVRCRLILWIWNECRTDIIKRAEERWSELWLKQHSNKLPLPRLEVRFTSIHRTDGYHVDLTPTKLGEVVLEVLPGVLDSMILFYEEQDDLPDDQVARDFFAKWLRSAGDGDLVAQVNNLLTQPSINSNGTTTTTRSPTIPADHSIKRPRQDPGISKSISTDVGRTQQSTIVAPPPAPYALGISSSSSPVPNLPGLSTNRSTATNLLSQSRSIINSPAPPTSQPGNQQRSVIHNMTFNSTTDVEKGGKKTKKVTTTLTGKNGGITDGTEDFGEWLDGLPYSERIRLEGQHVPLWELPQLSLISAPDLLKWKPPEPVHPFSGNGLKGPPFDEREWKRLRQQHQRLSLNAHNKNDKNMLIHPLSDLDWKITASVLKLLRTRGIDTLVSRGRGQVIFLDRILSYSESINRQLDRNNESDVEDDQQHEDKDDMKKKDITGSTTTQKRHPGRKIQSASHIAAQRRYGPSFFKTADPLAIPVQESLIDRIPDINVIRSFLEYDTLDTF